MSELVSSRLVLARSNSSAEKKRQIREMRRRPLHHERSLRGALDPYPSPYGLLYDC